MLHYGTIAWARLVCWYHDLVVGSLIAVNVGFQVVILRECLGLSDRLTCPVLEQHWLDCVCGLG